MPDLKTRIEAATSEFARLVLEKIRRATLQDLAALQGEVGPTRAIEDMTIGDTAIGDMTHEELLAVIDDDDAPAELRCAALQEWDGRRPLPPWGPSQEIRRRSEVLANWMAEAVALAGRRGGKLAHEAAQQPEPAKKAKQRRKPKVRKESWDRGLSHLRAFIEQHGHAKPPGRYVCEDGYKLGKWVFHCREQHSQKRLPRAQVRCLESLPGWAWSGRDALWDDGLRHLREFAEQHGHARPMRRHVCDDGFRLGLWTFHRRDEYFADRLLPERVRELEGLPGWVWSATGKSKD
jgi:hypothetical protein